MDTPVRYRTRVLDPVLDRYMADFSAIALQGAKGVGKTATARQRAASMFKLDDPQQLAVVEADLDRVLKADVPVVIDEWQLYPAVWDAVRNADDDPDTPRGRYLLTGSADPAIGPAHTGAGRIVSLHMRPLSLAERLDTPTTVSLAELLDGGRPAVEGDTDFDLEAYTHEILASGFPGLRRYSENALRTQLNSYISLITTKEFEQVGQTLRNENALRRWMAAYAAASSTTATFETIRDAATSNQNEKPARSTVAPYQDALQRLYILDPVPAWRPANNALREMGDAEKHQLVDPALAARLVRATSTKLLAGQAAGPPIVRNGTQLGAMFESLVTLSVRTYVQAIKEAEPEVRHMRTHRGTHEVDLIVERSDGAVIGIEVKLAEVPNSRDGQHLHWLESQIGEDLIDKIIITTGKSAYRRSDGIAVVPAALLGP